MILDALFAIFRAAVEWVLGLFPAWSPPDISGYVSAAGPVFDALGWANHYLPIDLAFVLVPVGAGLYVSIVVFRFSVWVLTKAHVLGGSSE